MSRFKEMFRRKVPVEQPKHEPILVAESQQGICGQLVKEASDKPVGMVAPITWEVDPSALHLSEEEREQQRQRNSS